MPAITAARATARTCIAVLALALALPGAAEAGWRMLLTSQSHGPQRMVGVDKSDQTFYLFERKSPLRVIKQLPCTTGQALGDKLVVGDKRTPEGVYFVGGRVNRGLDWDLYGNVAYTLNYPNPVDRLKGKTGSGIWVHGRGKDLVPRDTLGCVALKVDDIKAVEPMLEPGTPVIIAEELSWSVEPGEDETAAFLAEQVRSWAGDWANKSDGFFDYYDPELFARSEGAAFTAFKDHKKGIFSRQPWIEVMADAIRVAPGPDYWVTWFDQYYRTESLTSAVGKRFYWMRSEDGRWRIVGREYTDPTPGLQERYLKLKSAEVEHMLGAWLAAWREADLDAYMGFYADGAVQDDRRGREDIADYKGRLWADKEPTQIDIASLDVDIAPQGLSASFTQQYHDASGYSDTGVKTLILAPGESGWIILSEQWRRLE